MDLHPCGCELGDFVVTEDVPAQGWRFISKQSERTIGVCLLAGFHLDYSGD
jgi:hypothetical protein